MTPFNLSPPYLPTSHGLSPSARHKRTRSREARTPAPIVATKGAMLFFILPENFLRKASAHRTEPYLPSVPDAPIPLVAS